MITFNDFVEEILLIEVGPADAPPGIGGPPLGGPGGPAGIGSPAALPPGGPAPGGPMGGPMPMGGGPPPMGGPGGPMGAPGTPPMGGQQMQVMKLVSPDVWKILEKLVGGEESHLPKKQ